MFAVHKILKYVDSEFCPKHRLRAFFMSGNTAYSGIQPRAYIVMV